MHVVEGLVVPKLTPGDVRAFVVDDDAHKRESVVESLAEFGLATDIVVVDTYDAAEAFMSEQVPNKLTANVFVFDGEIDEGSTFGTKQGSRLADILFNKYTQPLLETVDRITESLKEGGLTRRQIAEIVKREGVYAIAAQQLGAEALLVGISRTESLGHPAQLPLIAPKDIGKIVFDTVIPVEVRNRIAKQQKREADRLRSQANR